MRTSCGGMARSHGRPPCPPIGHVRRQGACCPRGEIVNSRTGDGGGGAGAGMTRSSIRGSRVTAREGLRAAATTNAGRAGTGIVHKYLAGGHRRAGSREHGSHLARRLRRVPHYYRTRHTQARARARASGALGRVANPIPSAQVPGNGDLDQQAWPNLQAEQMACPSRRVRDNRRLRHDRAEGAHTLVGRPTPPPRSEGRIEGAPLKMEELIASSTAPCTSSASPSTTTRRGGAAKAIRRRSGRWRARVRRFEVLAECPGTCTSRERTQERGADRMVPVFLWREEGRGCRALGADASTFEQGEGRRRGRNTEAPARHAPFPRIYSVARRVKRAGEGGDGAQKAP